MNTKTVLKSFYGLRLSATMAALSNDTISAGIRAPLTIDESDFEYSVSSSKSRRNSIASSYYSNSELESEGFVSGEDESETRPYVADQHEEILEETHFFHEYGFYKPSLVKPNGEIIQKVSFSNENVFSRPYVRNPDENLAQESGNVDGNSFFRPFVGNPDERICKVISNVNGSDDSISGDEFVENENYVLDNSGSRPLVAVINEENLENGPTPISDIIKISEVQKLYIPIAKISRDSDDDDSQGSEGLEDKCFLDIVRVPSFEVLRRLNSAPKIRMSEDDEGDGYESQAENMVEMEFVKDLVISNCVSGPKDGNEPIDVEDVIKCVISSDTVQDRGPDVNKEDKASSLAVNEEYNSISESGQNRDFLHLDEEIQEFHVTDDRIKCVDLVDCSNTGLEDNFVFNQNVGSEKLETDSELEIEQTTVESFSFIGADKISSLYQHVDIKDMSGSYLEDASLTGNNACISFCNVTKLDQETTIEAEHSEELPNEVKKSIFHDDANTMLAKMERGQDSMTPSDENILLALSHEIDCQTVADSDEGMGVNGRASDCGQIINSAALASSFKAVKVVNSDVGAAKSDFADGVENFSLERNSPDLGSVFSSTRQNIEARIPEEALSEREKTKKLERLQQIRVKYLRLVQRLGHFPEDSVASEVLRQLSIAEAKLSSQTIFLNSAKSVALELEAREKDNLDISLCILLIGKTGVGKSATINSIFGENKTTVNAFEPSTTRVKEIIGNIDGIKVKVFDTPGLSTFPVDQKFTRKVLSSIKKLMRKSPPDVILYVDRLDTQYSNLNDLPLLKSLTLCLGSSIWQKSIIAFTHSNLVPPDGPDGYPLSYEEFIAQQSRAVQQLISQSAGEMNDDWTIPVSLVENHPFANGEKWRSKLMFLCYSMKILSEVSSVVKIDNLMDNLKVFFRLCFLEPSCRILSSAVFEPYDDCGYDGVLIEDNLDNVNRLPAVFSIQLAKDKKKDSKVNVIAGLNKKPSGRISVKTSGLDQLQIAALAFFPIAKAVFDKIFRQSAE